MEETGKSKKPMSLSERLRMELNQQPEEQKPIEGPQLIKHRPASYDAETGQLYSYYESAMNQTQQFIQTIFGGDYTPQHQFSFKHKKNIVKYVFEKNNVIAERLSKEIRKPHDEKELQQLLQEQNRMILVSQLAQSRNRIGITAYCWGALLGCLCLQLPISIWRKGALGLGIFHMFGSYVSWTNIDRVFDKVYPFYVSDLESYRQELQSSTFNELKQTKLDRELEEKRLKKFLKEISSNKQ